MTTLAWREFLSRLSREVIADARQKETLPSKMVSTEWLGYPPASDIEIADLENRIGKRLPPSYRTFLQVSNGWKEPGPFVYDLLPINRIGWFRDLHPDWLVNWMAGEVEAGGPMPVTHEEHCVYGPEQNCCTFRNEYWQATLTISEIGDSAIFLLNPEAVDSNGEWESWFFANWNPGARRFRSFWEMMQEELESFVRLRKGGA